MGARNFQIFPTIVEWFTKDRTNLNSFNILDMVEVQQGQELLRNYIVRNRMQKICFCRTICRFKVSPQHVFHIQEYEVQKSISYGISFSKVTSLHCTDCSSTIYWLYHIYFWSLFQKLAILKRIFSEIMSMMYQRLNKIVILPKRKLTLDLVEEALKILMYLQESLLGTNFFW